MALLCGLDLALGCAVPDQVCAQQPQGSESLTEEVGRTEVQQTAANGNLRFFFQDFKTRSRQHF